MRQVWQLVPGCHQQGSILFSFERFHAAAGPASACHRAWRPVLARLLRSHAFGVLLLVATAFASSSFSACVPGRQLAPPADPKYRAQVLEICGRCVLVFVFMFFLEMLSFEKYSVL